jgi:hypothetical protein
MSKVTDPVRVESSVRHGGLTIGEPSSEVPESISVAPDGQAHRHWGIHPAGPRRPKYLAPIAEDAHNSYGQIPPQPLDQCH